MAAAENTMVQMGSDIAVLQLGVDDEIMMRVI